MTTKKQTVNDNEKNRLWKSLAITKSELYQFVRYCNIIEKMTSKNESKPHQEATFAIVWILTIIIFQLNQHKVENVCKPLANKLPKKANDSTDWSWEGLAYIPCCTLGTKIDFVGFVLQSKSRLRMTLVIFLQRFNRYLKVHQLDYIKFQVIILKCIN